MENTLIPNAIPEPVSFDRCQEVLNELDELFLSADHAAEMSKVYRTSCFGNTIDTSPIAIADQRIAIRLFLLKLFNQAV